MSLSLAELKVELASLEQQAEQARATFNAVMGAKNMVLHLIAKLEQQVAEAAAGPEPAPATAQDKEPGHDGGGQ